ncbi:MAG: FAD-binding oxidoreductase [Actinomycetota bacterium]|nr:FAD-binding oxidoreductase [Actinomycetota bacterium]
MSSSGPSPRRRLKHWGWGYEDQVRPFSEVEEAAAGVRAMFGFGGEARRAVPLDEVDLRAPRIAPPKTASSGLFTDDRHERAVHALGKAYRDIVRGHAGEFPNPPDLVAFPVNEDEVTEVLDRAAELDAAVIPFGGGTSVCGGVEPRLTDSDRPSISLDLTHLDQVLEIDRESLTARIQGGARGPALEDQLRRDDLTLRHYPQSFEYATLGGWLATRAGGHFATGETHIDDLSQSIRAVTPNGEWQSRRLPGSGAGPSPDRLLLGSEGILGVITEAWMRVRPRPVFKASATVEFPDFVAAATGAVRLICQSRLGPSNCRLIDPVEALTMGAGDGSATLLLLGFESAHVPVGDLLDQAIAMAEDQGGRVTGRSVAAPGEDGAGQESSGTDRWRGAFLMAPYFRDTLVSCGVLSETFETAIPWDNFAGFHAAVTEATRTAVAEISGAAAEGDAAPRVCCRLTHVYPDGAAPYFTVLAPAVRGGEVEQWDEIKAAASQAIIDSGGTITHHHAVGRDHRPWYDQQRPAVFADALAAAKRQIDPTGMLNPGVLIG